MLISSWSIYKHGCHRQFLFLKIFSEAAWLKWAEIWWEAPMEGSVLSFLKAEWKVSDTVLRYLERFKSYDQKKTEILRFRWDKMARNRIKLSFLSFDRLISQNIAIAECWNWIDFKFGHISERNFICRHKLYLISAIHWSKNWLLVFADVSASKNWQKSNIKLNFLSFPESYFSKNET